MENSAPQEVSLTGKVVASTAWMFGFQVLDNLLGLLRLFILARILTSADFGLVGVATLTKQVIDTFTQSGIGAFLIYKKDSEKYLDVSWTFLLIRGVILSVLVYLAAPLFGAFFNSPTATDVIRIVGFTFLIDALTNISVITFQKNLEFSKVFILQLAGNAADAIVAITCAVVWQNYWAIVAGMVVSTIVRVVLSYTLSSYRPRFDFNFKRLREMHQYGKWVFGSTILQFLYGQADDILVGRLLGTTALGYYQLAYRISNMPTTQITHIINTVVFPAYSQVQGNLKKLTAAYLRLLQATSFLSFLVGMLIIVFAGDFIVLVLGNQWLPMKLALQILTVWGILRSLGATAGSLWNAMGKPSIATKIQLVQTVIIAIYIFPLTLQWGYTGTAASVVVAALIGNAIAYSMVLRTLQIPNMQLFKELFIPLSAAVIAGIVCQIVNYLFFEQVDFVSFVVRLLATVAVYIGVVFLYSRYANYSLIQTCFFLSKETPALRTVFNFLQKVKKKP
ncbi:MAG: lipopolysaccharide biosynthesis protein [Patescibacteria group bacterium]|nr:lipopolysaccharide biosynthesis protein [Patescibacteria group bacterium]